MILFGALGALSRRRLLPALENLVRSDALGAPLRLVGVDLEPLDHDGFRRELTGLGATRLAGSARYVPWPTGSPDELAAVGAAVGGGPVTLYLSIPPSSTRAVVDRCGEAGLLSLPGARVALEKPIGLDGQGAAAIEASLARWIGQEAIFRVDHYLAKPAVEEFATALAVVRAGGDVAQVTLTLSESEGVRCPDRYAEVGVLRDMVQSHALQLLASLTMERTGDPTVERRLAALRAIATPTTGDVRLGACTASTAVGEPGAVTYARLNLRVNTPRWRDVPFKIRVGKSLPRKAVQLDATLLEGGVLTFSAPAEPAERCHQEVLRQLLTGAEVRAAISAAEVAECWRIVDPLLAELPLHPYAAGSEGPPTQPVRTRRRGTDAATHPSDRPNRTPPVGRRRRG